MILFTILSAQIRIPLPFTPVPMTLQTFVAPLAGAFLGPVWGAASMFVYLILGVVGMNVFAAAPSGVTFFAAPTAGYVLGFIAAALVLGCARERNFRPLALFIALLLSHLAIFLFGVGGLILNAGMGVQEAIWKGVIPFLPGDVLKLAASYPLLFLFSRRNT
jgi:biotin transport system substrate-specific component